MSTNTSNDAAPKEEQELPVEVDVASAKLADSAVTSDDEDAASADDEETKESDG